MKRSRAVTPAYTLLSCAWRMYIAFALELRAAGERRATAMVAGLFDPMQRGADAYRQVPRKAGARVVSSMVCWWQRSKGHHGKSVVLADLR